ncbi:GlxA family transcriptional regulator [Saccharopolyspora griseoalba]|uniref:GlxA family transcriptional regulator n=1 Tax=Saccharopolyspora griseoalba TaxID=1431848 RepID=A0ABW2LIN4_9PSEU
MHRVVVLALDGVYPFELGIPQRVFGSAGRHYEVLTCTVDGEPVRADADFAISVEHGPELLSAADTVVIPPFDMSLISRELHPRVTEALERIRPGTRIVSICTAAFVLAAAGKLDGRQATTHWRLTEQFRAMFPAVRLDPDVLFVEDGHLLTSAGAASGIDVCLHMIRSDHGSDLANRVARTCVVPPFRDGGQAQYIEQPVPEPTGQGTAATRHWAYENLHLPLTVAELAEHAGMSNRTFARRFRDEVGASPGKWLTQQRLARARQLLETSDLTIDQIAAQVGFATAASLRQHLHAAIGVSPLTYRRTFRTEAVATSAGESSCDAG